MSKFHVGIQTQMLMLLMPHLMSHFSHINSDFWVKTITCEQFSALGVYHEVKNKSMVKNPEKKATREVFRKRGIAVVERTKEERSGSPQAFVLPKQSLHKLLEQTESGDTQPHKGSHART